MNVVTKDFEETDWLKLISRIRIFIDEYNLEVISIDLRKTNDKKYKYKARVKYGLGLR